MRRLACAFLPATLLARGRTASSSTLLTLLVLLVLIPGTAGAQTAGARITGEVRGEEGEPQGSVVIRLMELDSVGTLTGPDGMFELQVPPGRWTVLATVAGHDSDLQVVSVQEGDSTHLTMRIGLSRIPFAGQDWPVPEPSVLEGARSAVLDLVRLPEVVYLARSTLGAESDTVAVLVPWWRGPAVVVEGEPHLRLTRSCGPCVANPGHTIHGGAPYTSGEPHLRIGVRSYRTGTPTLGFCVGAAMPGTVLQRNCVGGVPQFHVDYAFLDGRWGVLRVR